MHSVFVCSCLQEDIHHPYHNLCNARCTRSGELIVAAYNLGVAHPPGYPLWTLMSAIFSRMPIPGEPRLTHQREHGIPRANIRATS